MRAGNTLLLLFIQHEFGMAIGVDLRLHDSCGAAHRPVSSDRGWLTGDTFSGRTMDLDHFKTVNDTWGHHVGDELLKEIATMLTKIVRVEDAVARIGAMSLSY